MPKGDREILKADCEDGYTRIANLILEAIPLARLSGVQTGICLFLWRRSYGWNKEDDAIFLGEFAAACGSSKAYVSKQLADLIDKNIIERRDYRPGCTPVYAFITSIAQWCKGCIDVQGLHHCATLNQEPASEPPEVEPPPKTERKTIKENIYSPESIQFQLVQQLCPLSKLKR